MANLSIGLVVIVVFDDNITNKVSLCDWWRTTDGFCYAVIAVYEYTV